MPRARRHSTPSSDSDHSVERTNEFRIHIAELGANVDEENLRDVFERFGTLMDVWIATASSFAFVVYKRKEEAQKAIDQMDGRLFGNAQIKVTWARPRRQNRARRHNPMMRCYKCGQRGHFR